jgi:hypothetical protein
VIPLLPLVEWGPAAVERVAEVIAADAARERG